MTIDAKICYYLVWNHFHFVVFLLTVPAMYPIQLSKLATRLITSSHYYICSSLM